jgi:OPA family sugar phosphate sensor protein UhpC-like MFS transporter
MKFFDAFQLNEPLKNSGYSLEETSRYCYWRIRIFLGMYLGYIFYYFSRKTLTFVMPSLIADLGFEKASLGILATLLSVSYGLSKFISGILSDGINPRYFMALGLCITGIVNILFSFSSSMLVFCILWVLNGWFQGWGWPPCARLLNYWYSKEERGTWWGLWNTSHSVGGAIVPILVAICTQAWGWRIAMCIPGLLCIFVSFIIFNRLRDTPQSLGLPTIEEFRQQPLNSSKTENSMSAFEALRTFVLGNKWIWLLGCSYFFVYAVRTSLNDWGVLFLMETKNHTLLSAGSAIFWFEVGGFFGSLASGRISDLFYGGNRGPVNVLFSLSSVIFISLLWYLPINIYGIDSLLFFLIGFSIFGPQMLIGMAAAELAKKRNAGASTGFIGFIAYLGAASAGYPMGYLLQQYGWNSFFNVLVGCSLAATTLLIPLYQGKAEASN